VTAPRPVDSCYRDPLELVWLRAVRDVGFEVERSHVVYASFDGARTLSITHAEHFDADDCLGQMLFHELCHALVAGPEGRAQQDWGLENVDYRHAVHEKATNRLQAALCRPHGLRWFFGTTTDFRDYYDALPEDPLAEGDDPAIELARRAYAEAQTEPGHSALQDGLRRTAQIAAITREVAPDGSLWRKHSGPSTAGGSGSGAQ
jgi:elongation factor P hydroxylase